MLRIEYSKFFALNIEPTEWGGGGGLAPESWSSRLKDLVQFSYSNNLGQRLMPPTLHVCLQVWRHPPLLTITVTSKYVDSAFTLLQTKTRPHP